VLPFPAERTRRPCYLGWIDPGALAESDQEAFVGKHMLKDAGEKAGLSRGLADPLALKSSESEKAFESGRFLRNKGKRLNRQHFRSFSRIT
jgi:hypothetical protein